MSTSIIDIDHTAKLSNLLISEDERAAYEKDLNNILNLVDQLKSVDTNQIEPMAHPMDLQQRLRPDVVTESDEHEKFQAIAPEVKQDLYLVPKVIESE